MSEDAFLTALQTNFTIEKQDGEALNELRTIHESNILQLMTLNKERQIEELEYEKINLNDPDMKLSANSVERFETNFQIYREAASGANGGKTGGGCGCN